MQITLSADFANEQTNLGYQLAHLLGTKELLKFKTISFNSEQMRHAKVQQILCDTQRDTDREELHGN